LEMMIGVFWNRGSQDLSSGTSNHYICSTCVRHARLQPFLRTRRIRW
jgi:hypothetical protein